MNTDEDPLDRFNYSLGTQTFDPRYQFTDENCLVETAKEILDMGSNILKISISSKAFELYNIERNPDIHSYRDLLTKEEPFRQVLDMPFAFYFFWCHTSTDDEEGIWKKTYNWHEGFSEEEKQEDYRQIYDLTGYLLQKFSGTGKSFYIGHWEGDWILMGKPFNPERTISDAAISGLIGRLNNRQLAIDNAIKDMPHENVDVYQYTEVVLVEHAMKGKKTITNDVLPYVNVDFVSFSSYASLGPYWQKSLTMEKRKELLTNGLTKALDYIELNLKPTEKDLPWEKRVFIGEYGFKITALESYEQQDEFTRAAASAALSWGCPFVLYWQMYDNTPQKGRDQSEAEGFCLITKDQKKLPTYWSHKYYYDKSRDFVESFQRDAGRAPTGLEYRTEALKWLEDK